MVNEGSRPMLVVPEEDVILKEISLDPSNSTPLIFRAVCNFVDVSAFPDKSPKNPCGADTVPKFAVVTLIIVPEKFAPVIVPPVVIFPKVVVIFPLVNTSTIFSSPS